MNFDTAIAVLKARLADLDSRDIPPAQRRVAELRSELAVRGGSGLVAIALRSELIRVTGRLDDMLQERGTIIRAIEELSGGVE